MDVYYFFGNLILEGYNNCFYLVSCVLSNMMYDFVMNLCHINSKDILPIVFSLDINHNVILQLVAYA